MLLFWLGALLIDALNQKKDCRLEQVNITPPITSVSNTYKLKPHVY